jgi:serine protease Do
VTTPAQVIAAVDAARKAGRSSVLLLVQRGTNPPAFVGVNITGK